MKFRGRGFKQVTGRANYADYWVYRGWLRTGKDFDWHWWAVPDGRPAPIEDPQKLSTDSYSTIDSGAHFFTQKKLARAADGGTHRAASDSVSSVINALDEPSFANRHNFTLAAYKVLGDVP